MRRGLTVLLLGLCFSPLAAMGTSEAPEQISTRTYSLASVRSLSVRGEVNLSVSEGDKGSLTITTNRALFDQMKVSRWWGAVSVAIQTGLRGPRETGLVTVVAVVPRLESLEVLDGSAATLAWPGGTARIVLRGNSRLELVFEGSKLVIDAQTDSRVVATGKTKALELSLRNASDAELQDLSVGAATLTLGEASTAVFGEVGSWSGTLRQGSRAVTVSPQEPLGALRLD